MQIIRSRARLIAVAVAGVLVVAASPVAGADHNYDHKPGKDGPRVEVVASGLNSPRGLDFGYGGILFIAEAGTGGDGPCLMGPEGDEVCFGLTGEITAWWHGRTWTVADGLPSYADAAQFGTTGPHDVVASPFGLVVPLGLGGDVAMREAFGPHAAELGTVLRVNPGSGDWTSIADLAQFEEDNDPDAGQPGVEGPDSNPFGVAVRGATVTAVDAGGNSVVEFRQLWAEPEITVLGVLPPRFVDAPPFLPPGTPQIPMQPVPTAVARHGASYYVGQLTGFPFPVGGANVYQLREGQEPAVYADGFTNIIDIAFDRRGRLLVLEMFTNGLLTAQDDPSGALWRVERDGRRTLIADGDDGLLAPAGVAVAGDGSIYVTNKAVLGEGQGEVLRIHP